MRKKILLFLAVIGVIFPAPKIFPAENDNPLELRFQRLSARRFIFSKNITLAEFAPSEIVNFQSMHPAFSVSENMTPRPDNSIKPEIQNGSFIFKNDAGGTCFFVGAINPFATFDAAISALKNTGNDTAEVGIDLARHGLRERVQLLAISGKNGTGVVARIYENAKISREIFFTKELPAVPFTLRLQLSGRTFAAFIEKDGVTRYIGHFDSEKNRENGTEGKMAPPHFGENLDFRNREICRASSFNLVSNGTGEIAVSSAKEFLSIGMGQADIRAISDEKLTPLIEENRLWFTITCRGIGLAHPTQGVISVDPSTCDVRFEGVIAFDFGDGLLRNAVASHLFFDRAANEWRAFSCDFGGSKNREGRSESHLFFATSKHDPRRGFSVMNAELLPNKKIAGQHEDPCIFYDTDAKKWRLLTSSFMNGNIVARIFESDTWNGTFREIAPPLNRNSTGTSIQKIGEKFYCFMGGANENLRIHAYPDLKFLGELKMDFQPHWPKPANRIWSGVIPLPEGFPHRYFLLTMDRENFPEMPSPTWSYGALYFYGAE